MKIMKKAMIVPALLAALALTGGAGTEAKAQSIKRIEFAKGKSGASVRGTTGSYGAYYVVRARSGQKLILNLSPAQKVGIKVETRGRYGTAVVLREERGGTFLFGLEESGDYTIFVGSTTGKTVSFALSVKIERLTDI
jgi:hypothetical protein